MAYKPYKMKGHALPGINQQEGHPKVATEGLAASSPLQAKEDKKVTKKESDANFIKRANRQRENAISYYEKKGLSKYDATQSYLKKVNTADSLKEAENRETRRNEKSPAKCPLVAALAPMAMQMIGGAMKSKEPKPNN